MKSLITHSLLVSAVIVTGACGATSPPMNAAERHEAATTAFVGIDVLAMDAPLTIARDQTVLIRGETIIAVGPRQSVRVPRDAKVIDGSGKYLMPGLVDAHVHLEHFDTPDVLRLFLAHGVTTVRNMDGRPHILAWREQVRTERLLGPQIVTAGPILDGAPPLLSDNVSIVSADDARHAVKTQATAGYDFIKVYTNLSPDAYIAIADEARKRGLPVAGHIPRAVPVEVAVENQRSIEHLADIGRWTEADDSPHRGKWHWSKLLTAAPIDRQKLTAVAERLAAAEVHVVPTMIQAERSVATADQLNRWIAAPSVTLVSPQFRDEWKARVRRASARIDGDDWLIVDRGREQRRAIVRALHAANVPLLVGTDTPNPFVVPGAAVHEEMERLADAGVPWRNVLIAATRAPCEFLGLNCGVIAPGRRADLIMTAANPVDSSSHLRPLIVVAAGRLLDPRELLHTGTD